MKIILPCTLFNVTCSVHALLFLQTLIYKTNSASHSTDSDGIDLQLRLSLPTVTTSTGTNTDRLQIKSASEQEPGRSTNGLRESTSTISKKEQKRIADRDRKRKFRKTMKNSVSLSIIL